MRQVYVVYSTDAWHSFSSRECKGIFTSKRSAVNAIVRNFDIDLDEIFEPNYIAKKSDRLLRAEAKRIIRGELEVYFQTQGYSTNYDIEVWNVNDCG